MLRFQILSGHKAGAEFIADKFPVTVGRSPSADLSLDDAGVWDKHFEIHFKRGQGLNLKPYPDAIVAINEEPVKEPEITLHNGDLISLGALKLRFGLSPVRQRGLFLREALVWLAFFALFALQAVIFLAMVK